MLKFSEVQDEETFKVCLEFWVHFTKELYNADIQFKTSSSTNSVGSAMGGFNPMLNNNGIRPPKSQLYDNLLHALRIIMVSKVVFDSFLLCYLFLFVFSALL